VFTGGSGTLSRYLLNVLFSDFADNRRPSVLPVSVIISFTPRVERPPVTVRSLGISPHSQTDFSLSAGPPPHPPPCFRRDAPPHLRPHRPPFSLVVQELCLLTVFACFDFSVSGPLFHFSLVLVGFFLFHTGSASLSPFSLETFFSVTKLRETVHFLANRFSSLSLTPSETGLCLFFCCGPAGTSLKSFEPLKNSHLCL